MLGRKRPAGQRERTAILWVRTAGERPQIVGVEVRNAHQLGPGGQVRGGNQVTVLVHLHGQHVSQEQAGAGRVGANRAGADEHHVVTGLAGDFGAKDARQRPGLRTTREYDAASHAIPCEVLKRTF